MTSPPSRLRSSNPVEIGVGFWSMQASYTDPQPLGALYRDAVEEVQLAEALGFDTAWIGEHHFSYDGYCPSPSLVTASWAQATSSIRLAVGVMVLPFHAPGRVRGASRSLASIAPGRIRFAMGIGYRDIEFRAAGLRVADRAPLTESHLAELLGGPNPDPLETEIWIGGNAFAAVDRAARFGCSLLLSETASARHAGACAERLRAVHAGARLGLVREVWVTNDEVEAGAVRRRLKTMWTQYAMHLGKGADAPRVRERMVERYMSTAVIGNAREVTAALLALGEVGVDSFALRVRFDAAPTSLVSGCLQRLSREVVPELRDSLQ